MHAGGILVVPDPAGHCADLRVCFGILFGSDVDRFDDRLLVLHGAVVPVSAVRYLPRAPDSPFFPFPQGVDKVSLSDAANPDKVSGLRFPVSQAL